MICSNCDSDLSDCVKAGVISSAQLEAIKKHSLGQPSRTATGQNEVRKSFNPIMVAYYLGALLILSAFGWFLGSQWDSLGAGGILTVTLCYAGVFVFVGRYLASQEQFPVAAGLIYTCAVGMVPLAVYSVEALFGIWPKGVPPGGYHGYYVWINGSWIIIELSTVVVTLLVLRKVKFAFLVMPMAIALWFMSMDISEIIFLHKLEWHQRSWVSVATGLLFLLCGYIADKRSEGVDYAFWIYLAGLLAFWGGLSSMDSNNELGKVIYLIINLGLLAVSLKLGRKTFAVFGACGVWGYVGHLAWGVFKDSPLSHWYWL
jgi:hypothetical protein